MRVSEHYRLGRSQPELDFVDVEIDGDSRLFIDPRAFLLLDTDWGRECVSLIQDFFSTVLDAIHAGHDSQARRLLGQLREPNETRLGLSTGPPRGRGLGPELADRVWDRLSRSEAVRTRLLTDLEDTILLIEGIGPDLVSDITTNVVREPLIQYTQEAAAVYGINVVPGVGSGALWDPAGHQWTQGFVEAPVAGGRKLVLVPKTLVRQRMDYDADEYFSDFILEQLRADEFADPGSALVEVLKNGRQRVTKKALIEKYGKGKRVATSVTLEHPELLARYRALKERVHSPLVHAELADATGGAEPDWNALLAGVIDLAPGTPTADTYHRNVDALLTALFWPALTMPRREYRIHEGRKRIDIMYANVAQTGFFGWLGQHHPASNVFVECKNYAQDIGNPELDQLSGRFSPSRGTFGLILCRGFDDKARFIARCRDTAQDNRGFIVVLDDDDLRQLVEARKAGDPQAQFEFLRERFSELVM